MNPVPLERSILVMDNCIIHHNQDVLIALQTAGITVRFLPPYSPDLNPVRCVRVMHALELSAHMARVPRAAKQSKALPMTRPPSPYHPTPPHPTPRI